MFNFIVDNSTYFQRCKITKKIFTLQQYQEKTFCSTLATLTVY